MAKKSAAATNKARYEQIAEELAAPITEEAGVYIYDVDYHKEGEDFLLCVYIDKEGGVTIENNDVWGNRTILSHVGKNQFFAETYGLLADEPMLVDVVANED